MHMIIKGHKDWTEADDITLTWQLDDGKKDAFWCSKLHETTWSNFSWMRFPAQTSTSTSARKNWVTEVKSSLPSLLSSAAHLIQLRFNSHST